MCRLDAYFVGSLSMLVLLLKCLNSLLTVYKMKSQVKYLRVIFQILSMSDSFFFFFFVMQYIVSIRKRLQYVKVKCRKKG